MFVEIKEAGEITEAPAKTLKLSEAIRKGLLLVEENRTNWRFCALGAAFAGVHGRQMTDEEGTQFIMAAYVTGERHEHTAYSIADALGFSRHLCERVNKKHNANVPAARIADWLEAQSF